MRAPAPFPVVVLFSFYFGHVASYERAGLVMEFYKYVENANYVLGFCHLLVRNTLPSCDVWLAKKRIISFSSSSLLVSLHIVNAKYNRVKNLLGSEVSRRVGNIRLLTRSYQ